jgi:competence protein ComEC
MGGFAILLFVIMTGFQSTAVRAGVMAGIVLFAKAKGRNAPTGRVIVFAACIMTVINPYTLYYDVSSQLSFLATLGIIYFAPRIAHWFARVPEKVAGLPLREMLTGTIGTQIFVLPYLLYKTGTLSVVSPITNILIIPFIPYLMVFSSIVAILGVVYFPIAMPFALIGGVISVIILFIIHITAQIPLAAFTVKMPLVVMLMVYAFLFHYFDPFGMRKVDITKKESKV